MEEFIKVSEAARRFNVAPFTIRKWARLKLIDAVKVGNRWLIKADTLEKKLNTNAKEAKRDV